MPPTLTELAERVERLTGPDRAMDCQIAVAVGWFAARKGQKSSAIDYVDIREAGRENWPGYGGDQLVPHLTESLDDAMPLVPEGCTFAVGDCGINDIPAACITDASEVDHFAEAVTPILALTAACLRAASENSHGR